MTRNSREGGRTRSVEAKFGARTSIALFLFRAASGGRLFYHGSGIAFGAFSGPGSRQGVHD